MAEVFLMFNLTRWSSVYTNYMRDGHYLDATGNLGLTAGNSQWLRWDTPLASSMEPCKSAMLAWQSGKTRQ